MIYYLLKEVVFMRVKNQVKLKPKERKLLKQLISKGIEKARKITRCRILLLADEGRTDTQIIEALRVARNTIRQVRTRYVCTGMSKKD
jgi:putative transposase